MFGADTPLVIDALQIAGIAALAGIGGFALFLKRRQKANNSTPPKLADTIEERVRVLERIATDRTADLADEIEQLRDAPAKQEQT